MRGGSRVLVFALLLSSGCSIFLKGVDRDWEPPEETDCQPFIIVPIIDGVLGAALTGWAIGQPCRQDGSIINCSLGIAGGAAVIGTAVWGYLKVRKCQKARSQLKAPEAETGIP